MNKKILAICLILIIVIICIILLITYLNRNNDNNLTNESITQINDSTNIHRNEDSNEDNNEAINMDYIQIKVNNSILNVKLEDNSSAQAFVEKLKEGEIVIQASDYGNFEKVGDLGFSLPTNDTKITTEPGDLILYQGNQITLYYDTNTWNFTKLGKVQNISQEELKNILGDGDVTLTFSLNNQSNNISFNFETKTVKLNSNYEMPLNGIGTYSLTGDICYNSIISALDSGVRLIDTAYMYNNEEEIGRAIKDSNVPREEIFITTKLYPNQYDNPESAIDEALRKLDIEYIDLLLLHHPGDNDIKAYKAMEQAVSEGKVHSIGLSNWYIEELEEFLPQITITPAVVQNEIHPYYQELDVVPYIQSKGIVVEGWYPFGGRGHTNKLLNNETILEIANTHNVSSAQVILRWNLQRGVVVIPGSSNPEHIKENTEIYHFELTDEEMKKIENLNRDEKHDWY